MQYMCLGYHDEEKLAAMPADHRETIIREVLAYNAVLRKKGHGLQGFALHGSRDSTVLRLHNESVAVTNGPFAQSKEQLGGVLIFEATDLNHAIQLMSNHPGLRLTGGFEIRPINPALSDGAEEH